jgi:hypothetical protein
MVSVNSYIVKAHACDEYAASPSFLYAQSWVNQHDQSQIGVIHERTTRTLTNHYSLQPTEIIMVGTVSKKRLQCSPIGSFQGQHTLQDSKYELILERSYNPYFAAEYDVAMEHLPFVQTVESPDLESKGLLTSDGLMLGAKVFILRVRCL